MRLVAAALVVFGAAVSIIALAAESEVVSGSAIEKALTRTRTRGISIRDTSATRNVVDLNIPFELNSSELKPEAVAQLRELEVALKSAALARDRFLVAGHTDAKGDAEYNRRLSLRRAAAVRDFLVNDGIESTRLQSAGEGEDKLLAPDRPEDAVNRRVEITNLGAP